jgi:replicative DNA helicase
VGLKRKKTYDIEKGFLSKLIETGDIIYVKDKQIKPNFFIGENKRMYLYLNEYFLANGSLPTNRVLLQKFPQYHFEEYENEEGISTVGTEEPLSHWCTELRRKKKHDTIATATESIAGSLDEMETDEAYNTMKKTVLEVESEIEETRSLDITKDTQDRKRVYEEREKTKGITGIPSSIPLLDYILKGFQKGTLTTVIAPTGVGKTWFEVLIGSNAQINGYKVLQFVTEMSEEQMRDRFEAMHMGIMMGEFNYNKFKSGGLDRDQKESYFKYLDKIAPKMESLVIEQATGVSDIRAKIELHKPDLVLVDGVYLMEDERGAESDWLRVAHITRDLKVLCANMHLPMVINSQADKSTSKKTGAEIENISYTQAIGQDSDTVLTILRTEEMIEDRESCVKVIKNREGILGKVMVNWDFDTMDFSSIYSTDKDNKVIGSSQDGVIEVA